MNFKVGDEVVVIAGSDKGKTGKIVKTLRDENKVIVEGVNIVKKTFKKTSENQAGGIKDIEAYLDISNVMLICPKCKKDTRVGFVVNGDAKKRICKKCKAEIE